LRIPNDGAGCKINGTARTHERTAKMKKEITVRELADELIARIDMSKGIDCCKEEIKALAKLAQQEIPERKLMVNWQE
jgi:hypothetical protein